MKRNLIISIILLSLFASCDSFFVGECFSGEANLVRKKVVLDEEIKRIYIMGEAEIYLMNDSVQSIEYEFPENLVEDLEFRVEGDELIYGNHVTCKWRKNNYAPKLFISLPHIRRFDILEYAPIRCLDTLRYDHHIMFYSFGPGDIDLLLNLESFSIQSDYVADISVKGRVERLSMYYKLHGRFYGQELYAQKIKITHNGENDVHLYPVKRLEATIQNYGNIILHHQPDEMEVTTEAEGKILFAGE